MKTSINHQLIFFLDVFVGSTMDHQSSIHQLVAGPLPVIGVTVPSVQHQPNQVESGHQVFPQQAISMAIPMAIYL
jgi:hypothetical protein